MKKRLFWIAATALHLCTVAFAQPDEGNTKKEDTIPSVPVGILSATPHVVQTGAYPTLNWSIVYPSKVGDVASVLSPGTIRVNKPMFVSVRPIGVGVTECVRGQDVSNIHAEVRISINGGDYKQLFYGTNDDVEPFYSLYIKKLIKGTTIDFGGRFVKGGKWTPFYTTRSSNLQVITLAKGDVIPTSFNLHGSGQLASYLKPYVDGTGRVKIGPMSLLVMMEMASTNHSNTCFDYQDLVLLVTFSEQHSNNGHGNNLDGVDCSNPGKGAGGPSGDVDPSGGEDDEIR